MLSDNIRARACQGWVEEARSAGPQELLERTGGGATLRGQTLLYLGHQSGHMAPAERRVRVRLINNIISSNNYKFTNYRIKCDRHAIYVCARKPT